MLIVVPRDNNLGIKLGFLIKPPLKLSPNDKMLSLFKNDSIYVLKSTHKS